jgi:hypothetical protein
MVAGFIKPARIRAVVGLGGPPGEFVLDDGGHARLSNSPTCWPLVSDWLAEELG